MHTACMIILLLCCCCFYCCCQQDTVDVFTIDAFGPCELLEIIYLKMHFGHYFLVFNFTKVVSLSGYTSFTGFF